MNVGETLKYIVEQRKDDYLEAKELGRDSDYFETQFIAAVNAYAIWISE